MFTILVEVRTGGFESALSLYQQAYSIHPSEKLMAKIKKIQVSGCATLSYLGGMNDLELRG